MYRLIMVIATFKRSADEHGRKVGEDERLQKSHQHLDKINEYRETDSHR